MYNKFTTDNVLAKNGIFLTDETALKKLATKHNKIILYKLP